MKVAVLPGYSRYEILETGVVRYRGTEKICPDYGDGKFSTKRGRGYRRVKIYNDQGSRHCFSVHRLVWWAFFGEIPKDFDVDHIDFDRGNNCINNLRVIPSKRNRTRKKRTSQNLKDVGTKLTVPTLFD